ncbi:MAG: helix-turn-helix domain-containing protein, partial [Blautia sp.]|nr:helix-turn-helix domain-containing protein [Blautia sp.]
MSFKAIGKQILKDCTTVSKEVKAHIIFEKKG